MPAPSPMTAAAAIAAALVCAAAAAAADPGDRARADYDRFCLPCHGLYGDGKGPAYPWLWPRPRDFTTGSYKWRSTATGDPPTDADLALAIRAGVPGTTMHAFASVLSEQQVAGLVAVVKQFAAQQFELPVTEIPVPPTPTTIDLARGVVVYSDLGCPKCHGDDGRGQVEPPPPLPGTTEEVAPAYDLTEVPLRRPHMPGSDRVRAIYRSLVTGLAGTPMPSYADMAPEADLWAVAAFSASLIPADGSERSVDRATTVSPQARERDREERLTRTGFYPGNGTPAEAALFGGPIAVHRRPSTDQPPAVVSLHPDQCARCHAAQHQQWRGSLHAQAGSPGLIGQLLRLERHGGNGAAISSCQRCHAPLAEQNPLLSAAETAGRWRAETGYVANPVFDGAMREQGLTCAGCHVRDWTRYGPPRATDSRLLPLPGYPMVEEAVFERSDFCLPCHQLTPRSGLGGRPLLNTYVEWLEGPYMPRGVQCQHCHMPNRDHTWNGVHDPDTFRQGVALEAIAGRSDKSGAVSVRARVTNVGAGHYLPTTTTPAAWLRIELVDARGRTIEGATSEKRIGRNLVFENGRFRELEDTRIPPGQSAELAAAWRAGRVDQATHARVSVVVAPDDYYAGLYRKRLRSELTEHERDLFQTALERAEKSRYTALDELIAID